MRWIDPLSSRIASLAMTYQLTPKYTIGGRFAYDFGDSSDVYTSMSIQRKFDRFFVLVSVFNDANSGESGFNFGIYPEGLGSGASTDAISKVFGGTQ
jgi:hypothetical protein